MTWKPGDVKREALVLACRTCGTTHMVRTAERCGYIRWVCPLKHQYWIASTTASTRAHKVRLVEGLPPLPQAEWEFGSSSRLADVVCCPGDGEVNVDKTHTHRDGRRWSCPRAKHHFWWLEMKIGNGALSNGRLIDPLSPPEQWSDEQDEIA